jgi:phage-related protein
MDDRKEIRWVGSSYDDLLAFPQEARREAGFQLGRVQAGLDPTDWKPFDDVGVGTKEIRIRDSSGLHRVMYVAKFEEAVYVLHCFMKTTQATSKPDKAVAQARYRAVVNMRRAKK